MTRQWGRNTVYRTHWACSDRRYLASWARAPGFTLIELMLVVAIIGVLAAIAVPIASCR